MGTHDGHGARAGPYRLRTPTRGHPTVPAPSGPGARQVTDALVGSRAPMRPPVTARQAWPPVLVCSGRGRSEWGSSRFGPPETDPVAALRGLLDSGRLGSGWPEAGGRLWPGLGWPWLTLNWLWPAGAGQGSC
jgi:hypothetical protein